MTKARFRRGKKIGKIYDITGKTDQTQNEENNLQIQTDSIKKAVMIKEQVEKIGGTLNINLDGDDLVFSQYNFIDIGTLNISLWERISEENHEDMKELKKNGNFTIEVIKEEGVVILFARKEKEKEITKKLDEIFHKFFNYRLFDALNDYRPVDIKDLPDISNINNYKKSEKNLYYTALEGLSNSDCFRLIIVGTPGTGKTYYAKMCSRYLLEEKKVNGVILDNIWGVKRLLTFLNNIKSDLKLLFVVDEMETHTMSRNNSTKDGTDRMLQFLDGLSSFNNIRLIGITNLPQLMDKAIFRPGRIDMVVIASAVKNDKERIEKILKSISKHKTDDVIIKQLAEEMSKKFTNEFPISFYTHALKLYTTYKDLKKVMRIMSVFAKHKSLFSYNMGEEVEGTKTMGFGAGSSPFDDDDDDDYNFPFPFKRIK